jgi:uncharacterized membrane protein
MSVSQPPSDAPFGLQPNVAAGLAYLLGIVGGIIFLVGGGTNKFVKWSAAQSTTLWGTYIILIFALQFFIALTHMWILFPLFPILGLLAFIAWIWTTISGFQGNEVKVPGIAGLTESVFKGQL